MAVQAGRVQLVKVSAELNSSKIFQRARIASDIARERSAEAYVSCCCVVLALRWPPTPRAHTPLPCWSG
jgi:hypothetical protein